MGVVNSAVAASPETVSILLAYGPMGVFCIWLMWRVEKKMDTIGDKIPAELRIFGHRIDGLTRALLADVISRDTQNAKAKEIAQKMLTDIENNKSASV